MRTIDYSLYFVTYNLVIGLLTMLASEKIGFYAGRLAGARRARIDRLTRIATLTFGAAVAALSAAILIFSHWLRL